jgi:hypothetical protein
LRDANLPEARADEVLDAMRETVRDYQAAVDTLTVVIDREAQQGSRDSSESITPPRDGSEADLLREKLAGLRSQVQTAATQVKLDEEALTRQQSAHIAADQDVRRAQEEVETAKADAAIGIGYGAQTLMNNFISGLILLAEQRIKVGDLIDVDGHPGHQSRHPMLARPQI